MLQNNNFVALTHNDGDALGCICVLNKAIQPEKWFITCYTDLTAVVDELIKYCHIHQISKVVISDVSFSGNRKLLVKLIRELAKIRREYTLQIFDHHQYPENFWNGIKGDIHVNSGVSACKLLYNHFASTVNLYDMSQFIMDMNAFDVFDMTHSGFKEALIFGEFLKIFCNGNSQKIEDMADILAGYSPKYGYQYIMGKFRAEYENAFVSFKRDCLDKNVMIRSSKGRKITILMVPEYFNMFVYTEFKRGQDAVVCASNGCIRVRLNKSSFSVEDAKSIKKELLPANAYAGHTHAFPILLASTEPHKIVDMVSTVCENINKY